MCAEHFVMVVQAIDSLGFQFGRSHVSVQVLVDEGGMLARNLLADEHAERDEHHPFGFEQAVLLEGFHDQVGHQALAFGVLLFLQFQHQDGFLAFLTLREVIVQG